MAEYTIEVINGDIGEAMDRAEILSEESGFLYTIVKYRDFSEIVNSKAKYLSKIRDNDVIQKRAENKRLKTKLEKIEQIVNEWNNDASHSFNDMCKINGILKE